jgi:epoxyqueuosine reductase
MFDHKLLKHKITALAQTDPENRLPDGRIIFDAPLLGFASAADPIFSEFRKESVIGPAFRLPEDWLIDAVTVISYFLPFHEAIRRSNYGGPPPSVEWLHSRFLGESFNEKMRLFIVTELEGAGGRAVAPALHPLYKADYTVWSSNWSERHAAYAAGLGSFGLHRGLITEKGVAGRFGSVITNLHFPVTPRSGNSYYQNCPYLVEQSCGACIDRCPAGAITTDGKDKSRCYNYMFIQDRVKDLRESFGYRHSVCGKCQVDVPCEDCIP